MSISIEDEEIKKIMKDNFKEVIIELLSEKKEIFYEIFSEILEDYALGKAIEESENTGYADYNEVKSFLKRNK